MFKASKSFEVGIVFGVLNPLNGIPQFRKCIDNGVHWRDRGLRDILVLEKKCLPVVLPVSSCKKPRAFGNVPTKCLSSAWFDRKLYTATHGCNWHPIVIKGAVVIGISGDVGSHVRLAQ